MTLIQSVPIKGRIPSATLSVNELIKLDQAMMVHKILNEQCPEILEQKFTKKISGFKIRNKESEWPADTKNSARDNKKELFVQRCQGVE